MKNFIKGLMLLILTMVFYVIMAFIFHLSFKETSLDFFLSFAFIPMQIFVFTLIIDQSLAAKQKKDKLEKINMVIGTFFSEVGIDILRSLIEFDNNVEEKQKLLNITSSWSTTDYSNACQGTKSFKNTINFKKSNVNDLKSLLLENRMFMLNLIGNPTLLEHDSFTDMLWAIFHLADELKERNNFESLPDNDVKHLSLDMQRVYASLAFEWLNYMQHLSEAYPYLYSLELRRNPFNPNATTIIY